MINPFGKNSGSCSCSNCWCFRSNALLRRSCSSCSWSHDEPGMATRDGADAACQPCPWPSAAPPRGVVSCALQTSPCVGIGLDSAGNQGIKGIKVNTETDRPACGLLILPWRCHLLCIILTASEHFWCHHVDAFDKSDSCSKANRFWGTRGSRSFSYSSDF